jgi:hypothetical protein
MYIYNALFVHKYFAFSLTILKYIDILAEARNEAKVKF